MDLYPTIINIFHTKVDSYSTSRGSGFNSNRPNPISPSIDRACSCSNNNNNNNNRGNRKQVEELTSLISELNS